MKRNTTTLLVDILFPETVTIRPAQRTNRTYPLRPAIAQYSTLKNSK